MTDSEKKDLTYLDEARADYDRRGRVGETTEDVYDAMKDHYTKIVLTKLFPIRFILGTIQSESFCVQTLLDSDDISNYMLTHHKPSTPVCGFGVGFGFGQMRPSNTYDAVKADYDTRIRSGRTFKEMFDNMVIYCPSDILTKLFPYKFICENINLPSYGARTFCTKTLLNDDGFINYVSSQDETFRKKTWTNLSRTMNYGPLYDISIFEDTRFEFEYSELDVERIPLEYLSNNIDKKWLVRNLSEHPALTEEFVKNHRAKITWDFDILLKRGICSPDMELNVAMLDGTTKVQVPSFFPIYALRGVVETDGLKQSYFVKGCEDPKNKNMTFAELETDTIFILCSYSSSKRRRMVTYDSIDE